MNYLSTNTCVTSLSFLMSHLIGKSFSMTSDTCSYYSYFSQFQWVIVLIAKINITGQNISDRDEGICLSATSFQLCAHKCSNTQELHRMHHTCEKVN